MPNGNTAEGDDALSSLTTGDHNTAIGDDALKSDTTGNDNTASGDDALTSNVTGSHNTATGSGALSNNTTGVNNTANGARTLLANTSGVQNTASGDSALRSNTTGFQNTATGVIALFSNTTGSQNTATGNSTLVFNTTGGINTADGSGALTFNTTGDKNTAIGVDALALNTTGSNNIALGISAGVNLRTGNNNIDIGNLGSFGESNKIRIGTTGTQKQTFIAGISGVTVAGGVGVVIDANGQLGTVTSSARFKDEIKPMDKASEAILSLQPVTFRYKHELDPDNIPQFGLIAEQVERVNPDLVARDGQGKAYTVRYEAVNAMLLNEFLKEHRKLQQLEEDLRATIAQQQKQIKALAASLQKVSNQLEVSKAGAQIVVNNQ